jgi:hypothetical protein
MSTTHFRFRVRLYTRDGASRIEVGADLPAKDDAIAEAKRIAAKFNDCAHVLDVMAGHRKGIDCYFTPEGTEINHDGHRAWYNNARQEKKS